MEKILTINIDYEPHNCRFFEEHNSNWNLEISDWLGKDMGKLTSVIIG